MSHRGKKPVQTLPYSLTTVSLGVIGDEYEQNVSLNGSHSSHDQSLTKPEILTAVPVLKL